MKGQTFVLLILLCSTLTLVGKIPQARAGTITVPDDYTAIQAAINAASEGDTVFVRNGTYYENVVVNKTVSLIAESHDAAIIGDNTTNSILLMNADSAVVKGFSMDSDTFPPSPLGILLKSCTNSIAKNNEILTGYGASGIEISGGSNNSLICNNIADCTGYGIIIANSDHNLILHNSMNPHSYSIALFNSDFNRLERNRFAIHWSTVSIFMLGSHNNTITANTLYEEGGGTGPQMDFYDSHDNLMYHNNFEGRDCSVTMDDNSTGNRWDNGFEGNYWNNYNGSDLDHDGIGDTPYVINGTNQDNYPLMNPYVLFETIYIRADGSVEPLDAPLQREGNTYTLTENIIVNTNGIVIERSNVIVEGSGYTLQGYENGQGFTVSNIDNVTIRNTNIIGFEDAILASSSSNNTFIKNRITGATRHIIWLSSSSNTNIAENNLTENGGHCIVLFGSSNNIVVGNNIVGNGIGHGIMLYDWSHYNLVIENKVNNTGDGLALHNGSSNNTIARNNIIGSHAWGIWLDCPSNTIYHNNFIDNNEQVFCTSPNIWDNGCEGNYWGDYVDRYPNASCNLYGIWNTSYEIDSVNFDRYPLRNLYWNPADVNHDLIVDIFDIVPAAACYCIDWQDHMCHVDLVEPYGIVDIFDIVLMADSYGEEYHGP